MIVTEHVNTSHTAFEKINPNHAIKNLDLSKASGLILF